MRVSEIRVKQIRVKQGLSVSYLNLSLIICLLQAQLEISLVR